jgi:hypothetical protein
MTNAEYDERRQRQDGLVTSIDSRRTFDVIGSSMVRPLVSIAELVSSGRLVPQPPDAAALRAVLAAGRRDLEAAESNRASYAPWSDAMLYEAGLRAARVIVQAAGYRIDTGKGAHAATIDAADVLTDQRHHPEFTRLQRMRRRRNDFMYDTAPEPTHADLDRARLDVSLLLDVAQKALGEIV